MNNLLSYCGLVDAKIRASDIDLPVLPLAMLLFLSRVKSNVSLPQVKFVKSLMAAHVFFSFVSSLTQFSLYDVTTPALKMPRH